MVKNALLCTVVNFRKWIVNVKIYCIFILLFVFVAWHFSDIYEYAGVVGYNVSPWMFPHLLITPVVIPIFGFFAVLFFSDAPFMDRHMPFIVIRTGRFSWVLGQLFYIIFASFFYTIIIYMVTVLAFIPHIEFTGGWGKVITTLARNPGSAYDKGIILTSLIDGDIVTFFTARKATLISLVLFFLVTLFIGIVIFSLNLIVGRMCGIITAGTLVFISYFCIFVGRLTIGLKVYYFSPVSWSSLQYIDWYGSGESPSLQYAITFLVGISLLLSILSAIFFNRKDIDTAEGME